MLGGGDCAGCIDNAEIDYATISGSVSFFVTLVNLGIVSATAAVSIVEVEAAASRLGVFDCDVDTVIFDMVPMFRQASAEAARKQLDKKKVSNGKR